MSRAYVMERLANQDAESVIVGVDPDLHCTALCWWPVNRQVPYKLAVLRVPKNIKGQDCAAWLASSLVLDRYADLALIEGQRFRKAKGAETKNAQSLIDLAAVAGVLAAQLDFEASAIVEPSTWKGSVPKAIHQARVLLKIPGTKVKSTKTYSYPVEGPLLSLGRAAGLRKSDWKHVVDAIGIAQWGIKKIQEREARERFV